MHVLISHQSPISVAKLRNRLTASPTVARCHTEYALTATYDYSEHQTPDCVIISTELADCPEFELLNSLFRIMGIGCILFGPTTACALRSLSPRAAKHVVRLPENATKDQIEEGLRQATRQASRKTPAPSRPKIETSFAPGRVILIGASTGGIDALIKVVRHFTDQCPPTLIVQHTGGSFAQSLIKLLNSAAPATVEAAQDGAPLVAGHIYLAPGDERHLCLTNSRTPRLCLEASALMSGHRPSVDALFRSASPNAQNVTAALLTGMGRDGAQGLLELRKSGAHTIGQDETTSVVYGMPRVAHELGGVAEQLPIDEIGPALLRASTARARV